MLEIRGDVTSREGNCFIRISELQNIYFCTPHGNCFICEIMLIYYVSSVSRGSRVFFCTQKARNTQNCDLFHSRSVRMKTFCEFCGFCVRYYFLTSREGAKGAKIFINVITRNTLFFTLRRETVSSELQNIRTSELQNIYFCTPQGNCFICLITLTEK